MNIKAKIMEIYDEIASEYDERIPDSESASTNTDKLFTEIEIDFVLNKVKPEDKVLDMGCGTGRYTIPIAQKARSVTGFDLSKAMLEKTSEKAIAKGLKISLEQGDMAEMPFEDETFDLVTSILALMHIPLENRQKVFNEVSRILKPGGRMVIGVKNGLFEAICSVDRFASVDIADVKNKELIFTNTRLGSDIKAPWYSFTPQELDKLLSLAGLKIVTLRGNLPISAWISDKIMADPFIYKIIKNFETTFGEVPPFNHLGYYNIVEAVKPY